MGEVTPPRPDAAEVRYALGGGLMLLGAVFAAMAMAFVMSRTIGGTYVTFLMPALVGWVIGGAMGWIAHRFGVRDRLPIILTAVLAGLLAYGGYHVLAYAQALDFLSENLLSMVERAAADPQAQVLARLEALTHEQGVVAYLAFVSDPMGAQLSPIGLLGHSGLGLGTTFALMLLEAALVVTAALVSAFRRIGPAPAPAAAPRSHALLARLDDDGVVALMEQVEERDFEGAARVLAAKPSGAATHAVVLEHGDEDGPWKVAIRALDAAGAPGALRAERSVSSLQGQAMWDELRMLQRGDQETEDTP
ncbi:MAG: hypothetical protein EP329_10315 [Deltaproteobacteria bacterium]|nr:MAG: hypothetical protein EP329_10315 [Deltaproteobacteria bacterium]